MPECNNCGSFVTPRFARVFGDNEDEVDGCITCLTTAEITRGTPGGTASIAPTDADRSRPR